LPEWNGSKMMSYIELRCGHFHSVGLVQNAIFLGNSAQWERCWRRPTFQVFLNLVSGKACVAEQVQPVGMVLAG
jgi:hypothetical protein